MWPRDCYQPITAHQVECVGGQERGRAVHAGLEAVVRVEAAAGGHGAAQRLREPRQVVQAEVHRAVRRVHDAKKIFRS